MRGYKRSIPERPLPMKNSFLSLAEGGAKREPLSPAVKLALDLGPLILFFVANARPKLFQPLLTPFVPETLLAGENAGLYTATLVLMPAVVAALAVSWWLTRRLPIMPLVTAGLVIVFGALTFYLHDPSFIKMKPTVLYVLFGLTLYGGLALKKPLLPVVFDRAFDLTERGWHILTLRWANFFFVLAGLNELVWRTQSNDIWVAFKFPGIFILVLLFSLAQAPLIMRHTRGEQAK
jgi:intracellular septation protein